MSTRIYAIRHGETNINKANRHQSGEITEEPLNERGISQAKELGKQLENLEIDVIYCSPLVRAKQTCEIALGQANHNCEIVFEDRLIERLYGYAAGLTNEELGLPNFREDFWDIGKMQEFGRFGESVLDLQNRIFEFLEEIEERHKGKNIAMFSHAGVCRMIYIYFNGAPEDGKYRKFDIPKATVMQYEFRK